MRLILTLAMGTLLSSCASISNYFAGDDNADPPMPLPEYSNALQVTELWQASVGDGFAKQVVQLVPAIGGDRVFAADRNGLLAAFNKSNGEQLWENDTELAIAAGPGYGSGIIVVGTSDAEVVAFNEADGKVLWKVSVSSEVLAVPKIVNDVVVVRTIDGRLYGLDASNGSQKWFYDWQVPVLSLRGNSAPAVNEQYVVAGLSTGKVVALNLSDGDVQWEGNVTIPTGRSDLERMVDIDADPMIVDNSVFVVTYQGQLASLELETGTALWKRDVSAYAGLTGDWAKIYVVDDHSHVWAVDASNGASFWKQSDLGMRKLTAPVIQGDYLVVGDYEGYLHWLNRSDGAFAAKLEIDGEAISSGAVVDDKVLYVYSDSGKLAAVSIGDYVPAAATVEKPAESSDSAWWKPW